jgi:hypothetical protein
MQNIQRLLRITCTNGADRLHEFNRNLGRWERSSLSFAELAERLRFMNRIKLATGNQYAILPIRHLALPVARPMPGGLATLVGTVAKCRPGLVFGPKSGKGHPLRDSIRTRREPGETGPALIQPAHGNDDFRAIMRVYYGRGDAPASFWRRRRRCSAFSLK